MLNWNVTMFLFSLFLFFFNFFLFHQKIFIKLNPRSNIFQFPKALHFVRKIDPLKYFHPALKISVPNTAERGPKICSVSKPLHWPTENVKILSKIVSLFPYIQQKFFSPQSDANWQNFGLYFFLPIEQKELLNHLVPFFPVHERA